MSIRIAVVADTHFRPPTVDAQRAYASDAVHNERSARAVALARATRPDAIVHLGDVVHPLPVHDREHLAALAVARATTDGIEVPLIVVPGNHDVGDKPRAWEIAPTTDPAMHAAFRATWGDPWRAIVVRGVRLIALDTPIFGTGSSLEHEQWGWFERELAAATARHERIVVLLHYPPYLYTPDEAEHYDNLGEPGRSRLLALLHEHRVEVVLCGHVHHPFFDRVGETSIYILPSTAFTRPEYAELSKIDPAPERGRDDAAKLGFLVLHLEDDRTHRVEWVRTGLSNPPAPHPILEPGRRSAPASPIGVFLRDDWSAARDVPYGSLDEVVRKRARPDAAVFALFELGIRAVRIPWGDLSSVEGRRRMEALATHGIRAIVFTAGVPTAALAAAIDDAAPLVAAWEVLGSRGRVSATREALAGLPGPVPRFLSAIGEYHRGGTYHSHFPPHGFEAAEAEAVGGPGVTGLVYRIGFESDLVPTAQAALAAASGAGCAAMLHVELPRGSEANPATDDAEAAARVAEAMLVAHAWRPAHVLLDPFVDLDRGYWPRRGLLDRRWNPRLAAEVARDLGRILADAPPARPHGAAWQIGDGWISPRAPLDGGVRLAGGAQGAPWWRPGGSAPRA